MLVLVLIGLVLVAGGALTFVGLRAAAALGNSLPSLQSQQTVSLAETTQILASDGSVLAYL
jgi:hypothetical protein